MIGIRLPKNKKISINDIKESLEPKYIYLKVGEKDEVLKEENSLVEMGEKVIKRAKFDTYLHSSVSGKVLGFEERLDSNGILSKFMKIENDFKEKNNFKEKNLDKLTKEEFINNIHENGIIGLGGAGFPTYIKYNNDNIKTLIINAVECEPYITADYMLTLNKIKEVIDTLNIIEKLFNIEEIYIAIKVKNRILKEKIIPYTTKYKKIKLVEVPNLYPMGWEKSLVRYIKHTDYEKLPIEKGIVISNISTIYSIYESLKFNKPLIERIITVTGNAINNPTNIKIKIGTPFNELLNENLNYKEKEVTLVSGGPMMGVNIEKDDFIIEHNLNSILVMKKIKEIDPITCLRCGKCSDHCPAKICPVLVKDNINNTEKLKQLDVNRCVECGICSFVCPSKINLREYLREAKKKVK